jgi:tRNA threonylcarbamoyl adenosine modification protein YeaZ
VSYLLIDTADRISILGIYSDSGVAQVEQRYTENQKSAGWLAGQIREMCSTAGISLKEIETFACGVGPGGFTSIRVGISMCKAIAQSLNKPVVGVNRLESIAVGHAVTHQEQGELAVHLPAGRGLEYAAVYNASPDGDIFVICEPHTLELDSTSAGTEPNKYKRVDVTPEIIFAGVCSLVHHRIKLGETLSPAGLTPLYIRGANIGGSRG